jgi:hypothetical protein
MQQFWQQFSKYRIGIDREIEEQVEEEEEYPLFSFFLNVLGSSASISGLGEENFLPHITFSKFTLQTSFAFIFW